MIPTCAYRSHFHLVRWMGVLMILGMTWLSSQEIVAPDPLKSPSPAVYEEMPPAPSDGILDNAEIFNPEQRKQLAAKIGKFLKAEDFNVFVATYTFVYGEEARQRAWRLGRKWLEGKQGVVVVFDKGGGGTSPAIGLIWQQDDQRSLQNRTIQGILEAASAAANKGTAEKPTVQVNAAVDEIIAGFARVRPILEAGHRLARNRQYMILGGVLGAMFLSLGVLMLMRRVQTRAARRNSESYLFPHVEIAPRYDAPFGGGVVVQMHYGNPAQPR